MRYKNYTYVAVAVLVVLLAGSWVIGRAVSPWARDNFVKALEKRFSSTVEIEGLDVSVFPTFRAVGSKMVFRHHGRTDVPPLFEVDSFTASTSLPSLLMGRVSRVTLEGLRITVARGRNDDANEEGDQANREEDDGANREGEANRDADDEVSRDADEAKPASKSENDDDSDGFEFVIGEVIADGTHLEILPKNPRKKPLTFDLFKLTLHSAGPGSAMTFNSVMTNPKPPGDIVTEGEFGPWHKESPRLTPVSGKYTFSNADLSVFKGISGILSSEGTYDGVLERIAVEGWTDTPDFTASGNPVHLKTNYSAVVDGTSGDTYLEPVEATFLQSKVVARGKVEGLPDRKGKAVSLDVVVNEARVEDMLAIAVPLEGEPPLTGPIKFTTKFYLPPGDRDVVEKLQLEGKFGLEESTFASKVQGKVDDLSMRAKGKPEQASPQEVEASFEGEFKMAEGTISFPRIAFEIPGANVNLSGGYALRAKELDFEGHLLMDAKISETVTGAKGFFLKMLDPFFRDKGRTSVPIKISGTVKDPQFGLAIGGAKRVKEKTARDQTE